MSRIGFLTISMVLMSSLVACVTVTHIESPFNNSNITNTIKPGTVIKITLKTSDEYTITVSSVNNEEILGEKQGERFKLDNIERIEVKKPTVIGKTVGMTAGVAIGYLMMALITMILLAIIGL